MVFRHFEDLDAVFESDTCDNLRQVIVPFSRRQVFDAAMTSLNTISLAVVDDNEPFVRTVLCRTVANTLSMAIRTRETPSEGGTSRRGKLAALSVPVSAKDF